MANGLAQSMSQEFSNWGNSIGNQFGIGNTTGYKPPNSLVQDEGMGWGGFFDNAGKIGGLATGLAGMYNAYNQSKLQKEAFEFQKDSTNRNVANQAVTINNQLENQAKMQAQMFGNRVGTGEYQQYLANNQKSVDGSAIG